MGVFLVEEAPDMVVLPVVESMDFSTPDQDREPRDEGDLASGSTSDCSINLSRTHPTKSTSTVRGSAGPHALNPQQSVTFLQADRIHRTAKPPSPSRLWQKQLLRSPLRTGPNFQFSRSHFCRWSRLGAPIAQRDHPGRLEDQQKPAPAVCDCR